MIRPKTPKPSKADETDAYELATLRDNDTCQRCRRGCGPSNRDHRKNRSQGGHTIVSNLQILGGTGTTGCHGYITQHPAEGMAEGWTVPSFAIPAEWPARRWIRTEHGVLRLGWVLYDDAGGITEITEADRLVRMGLVQDMTEAAF
ncbi:hypothetical protein QMG61_05375 [Cryobacterium sp. PH31-AA6]|uniref:HNH endonuclease n=1 Tax=Cryobacterium sp. PH31-AA6 TaxID=3046205 RepID=UPI0024B9CEB2|nr:hypothetical protein [Cryobacterium sp. PH31-AA6]MDJ0323193.1 hypothetical protein [Cryobacterium sp. PH31-AA6]